MSISARPDKNAVSNTQDHHVAHQSQLRRSCNLVLFLFPSQKNTFLASCDEGRKFCRARMRLNVARKRSPRPRNQRDNLLLLKLLPKDCACTAFNNSFSFVRACVSREEQVTLWGGLFGLLALIAAVVFCRRSETSFDLCAICTCSCFRNRSNKIAALPEKQRYGHDDQHGNSIAHETRL